MGNTSAEKKKRKFKLVLHFIRPFDPLRLRLRPIFEAVNLSRPLDFRSR